MGGMAEVRCLEGGGANSAFLEANPFLDALFPLIKPSIIDISILQVEQNNGDGSQGHVQAIILVPTRELIRHRVFRRLRCDPGERGEDVSSGDAVLMVLLFIVVVGASVAHSRWRDRR